jgi:hypothetical protein
MDVSKQLDHKFDSIYFSGAQTEISIGKFKVDEAIEVEGVYSMSQTPIYGYASTHFNTVAVGKVLVSGSIIINYVFDGYLYAFIKAAKEKNVIDAILNQYANEKVALASPSGPTNGIEKEVEVSENVDLFDYISTSDIKKFQDKHWTKPDQFSTNNAPARPEFAGPFNILVKDYKVGYDRDADTSQRTLIDCFINRQAFVRRVDGSPIVEVYQFIAKTIL